MGVSELNVHARKGSMKKYVLALVAALTLVGAGEAAAASGNPWKHVVGPAVSMTVYVPKAHEMTVIAKAPGLRGAVGISGKVDCATRDKSTSYAFSARGKPVVVKYLPVVIGPAGCIVTVKGTRNADVTLYKR
jgi:hypothetical protein